MYIQLTYCVYGVTKLRLHSAILINLYRDSLSLKNHLRKFKANQSYYSKNNSHFRTFRKSDWSCSMNKAVSKNFLIFTRQHLCWSLFLIKLQSLKPATLFFTAIFRRKFFLKKTWLVENCCYLSCLLFNVIHMALSRL